MLKHLNCFFLPSTIALGCLRLALKKAAYVEGFEFLYFQQVYSKIGNAALHSSMSAKRVKKAARELDKYLQDFLHSSLICTV
jgi:hypothetical protein